MENSQPTRLMRPLSVRRLRHLNLLCPHPLTDTVPQSGALSIAAFRANSISHTAARARYSFRSLFQAGHEFALFVLTDTLACQVSKQINAS